MKNVILLLIIGYVTILFKANSQTHSVYTPKGSVFQANIVPEVYSGQQILKQGQTSVKGQNVTLQTAGWNEGVYFVRAVYNGEIIHAKLVVKH